MKVLITREKEEGEKLGEKIKDLGLEPVLFPTIKTQIIPVDIDILDYDVFIFPSKNAVKFFFSQIDPTYIKDKTVISVGEKTKKYLEHFGIFNVLIPEVYSSEGVLHLIKNKIDFFKDKKILIPRAKKGIDVLPDYLKSKVKEIKVLPVYETVLNIPENVNQVRYFFENGEIDFSIFTSPSTFLNFLKIFPEKGKEYLNSTCITVIGTTTKKAIEKEGLKVCLIPQKFTVEGILEKIKEQLL